MLTSFQLTFFLNLHPDKARRKTTKISSVWMIIHPGVNILRYQQCKALSQWETSRTHWWKHVTCSGVQVESQPGFHRGKCDGGTGHRTQVIPEYQHPSGDCHPRAPPILSPTLLQNNVCIFFVWSPIYFILKRRSPSPLLLLGSWKLSSCGLLLPRDKVSLIEGDICGVANMRPHPSYLHHVCRERKILVTQAEYVYSGR